LKQDHRCNKEKNSSKL